MSRLAVVPIVEGHGDEAAARILLERIWREIVQGEYIEVLKPIRSKRGKLLQDAELTKVVELASLKLRASIENRKLVVILLDADKDRPAELGPKVLGDAQKNHGHLDIACVVANVEYETWFVAAAESLAESLSLAPTEPPVSPETDRCGKGWIASRFKGIKYSETIDQPSLTAQMDLIACRERSPSFDKLCRELLRRKSE